MIRDLTDLVLPKVHALPERDDAVEEPPPVPPDAASGWCNVGATRSTLSAMGRLRPTAAHVHDETTLRVLDHEAACLFQLLERSQEAPGSESSASWRNSSA